MSNFISLDKLSFSDEYGKYPSLYISIWHIIPFCKIISKIPLLLLSTETFASSIIIIAFSIGLLDELTILPNIFTELSLN